MNGTTDEGYEIWLMTILKCLMDELSCLTFQPLRATSEGVWELQTLLELIPSLAYVSQSDLGAFGCSSVSLCFSNSKCQLTQEGQTH